MNAITRWWIAWYYNGRTSKQTTPEKRLQCQYLTLISTTNRKMFNMVFPCQILKKKFWAEIPTNFAITKRLENSNLVNL